MITTEIRITEIERTALTRLLAKAEAEGVTITRDQDGRYFASSVSTPGKRYLVTGFSCECCGFIAHGRCKHHAALLSALGWLQRAPETDPGTPTACVHTTVVYHRGQRITVVDGPLTGKSAVVIHHDPNPNAKHPIEARTGRTGTITNLFAVNEVETWTEDDWARTAAEMDLDIERDLDDIAAYQEEGA